MLITILNIFKKTQHEMLYKFDLMETYHFGHNLCNSEPFLIKIGLKCAYLQGVRCSRSNRFEPGFFGSVRCGFLWFFYSEGLNCN